MLSNRATEIFDSRFGVLRCPNKGFTNDVRRVDRAPEQTGGDIGLISGGPLGRHRRRGSNHLQARRLARAPNSADEHGAVAALSPAIRVQLVEDQEVEALGRMDQVALVGASEHEVEHPRSSSG